MHALYINPAKWGRPCLPQEGEKKPPTEVEGFYN